MKRGKRRNRFFTSLNRNLLIALIIIILLLFILMFNPLLSGNVTLTATNCPNLNFITKAGISIKIDTDGDTLYDACPDNCPTIANADQSVESVYDSVSKTYKKDLLGIVCDGFRNKIFTKTEDLDGDGLPSVSTYNSLLGRSVQDPVPYQWTAPQKVYGSIELSKIKGTVAPTPSPSPSASSTP